MAEISRHEAEFRALGARVLIVSFNQSLALARQWNREVGTRFPHLIDPGDNGAAGDIYHRYRFARSVAGTWNPGSLTFYASQMLQGRELHPSHGQDVNMLAGDMVLDAVGRVALPYYSAGNTDRPSVQQLLAVVRELAAEGAAADATAPAQLPAADSGSIIPAGTPARPGVRRAVYCCRDGAVFVLGCAVGAVAAVVLLRR